ncbi:MAG TPA: hypothetical protein VJQ56_11425, partial [Blastocatellia bacterium]|nr:hypothetical protein [Blastocatellia bacterium]
MLAGPKLRLLSLAIATAFAAAECLAFQGSISPEVKQRYAQARRLLALGEKEKALEELKSIIQLAPEFVEAQRDYLDNQRDKAASFIEPYEGYVKQNPASAVYRYLLGKVYSSNNKREQSDAEFKKALELDPSFGWASFAMSTVTARTGDNARTLQLLEDASKHAGASVALRSALASTFLNRK